MVPNNGNGGKDYDVIFASGTLTQDIISGVTINQLFMSGGTLILANPLTLEVGLQFSGGSITSGTLNVAGSSEQSTLLTVNGTTINNAGDYTISFPTGNAFSGGGSVFNNSGQLLLESTDGTVSFNIPLNNTGTLSAFSGNVNITAGGSSSGTVNADANATLQFTTGFTFADGTQFTGAGSILFANNTSTTFSGTINNQGNLLFNSVGNFTDFVLNGDVTLTGTGTLTLISADRILGNGTLRNASTILGGMNGSGTLGNDAIGLVNLPTGVIEANVSGLILRIDPNAELGLTNTGMMQASNGGLLLLTGNGGGGFNNTGGVITAQTGSQVQLTLGAAITGGTLATVGTGEIHNLGSASLTDLTNSGSFVGNNNTTTTLSGTITNSGSILMASIGNFTDLALNGDVTLTGGGVVTLTQAARILGSGILTNSDNTVQGGLNGSGNIGNDAIGIVNGAEGLFDANVTGQVLLLDPNAADGFVNHGLLRASNGGFLVLTGNGGGGFDNTAATISALDGSQVRLTSGVGITGGTLSTVGTGQFHNLNSCTLIDLTNAGAFIGDNNTTTTLVGTINNSGSITLASIGNFTDLSISGDVTLTGGGVIHFTQAARILGSGLLINSDNIIQGSSNGSGNLGNDAIGFINQANGLFDANVAGEILRIDPGLDDGFTNNGTIQGSGGGHLLLTGNGGGAFNNDNGTIQALDGSEVQLTSGVTINGGIVTTSGSGIIRNLDTATLNGVTNSGTFIANNNTTTTFTGTITNTGSILLASVGNFTDLVINDDVTLTGGSTLSLQSAARILGSGTLFIGGTNGSAFTVQGAGNSSGSFGNNALTIVNRSGGVIAANNFNGNSDLTLRVDPGPGGLTNLGLMQASNRGILLLTGNGGGTFTNSGGLIQALDGSQVQLTSGATIIGGNLLTAGSGSIVNLDTATLSTLTNSGAFVGNNNTTTTLVGTITNLGSISLNSIGNFTDLSINGNVTLKGGGMVNLAAADRILGSGTLTNVDNTIQGGLNSSGSFGNDAIGVINEAGGVISGNVAGSAMRLDPSLAGGLTNQGLIQASNGGTVLLSGNGGGAFTNTGGTITAQTGSEVQLTAGASVIGGTLTTVGTGTFRNLDNATLQNLTNNGLFVGNNNTTTALTGTITNTGSISLASVGNFTDLSINGDVTLAGSGVINLTSADRILGSGTLTNAGNTIQGGLNSSGNFGNNAIGIVNQASGVISANTSGLSLLIDPSSGLGLINNGTMQAINGGILLLSGNGGGSFTNNGTVTAVGSSTVQVTGSLTSSNLVDIGSGTLSITGTGSYTQTGGTFRQAGGTVTSSTALNFMGGLVDARGTINSAVTNSANLQPALGGSGLIVNGAVTLLSSSKLTLQLGGLTQGSQYGYLNVNGTIALAGQLVVSFVNNFQASNNNNFTIISSTGLTGTFANALPGSRVNASDGSGSFLVTYTENNQITLTDFQPSGSVPQPSNVALPNENRTPSGSRQIAAVRPSADEPQPVIGRGRTGLHPRASTPRPGIVVQNSSQLLDLLDGAASEGDGTVVVHPVPTARRPANRSGATSSLPAENATSPGARPRSILPRNGVKTLRQSL